MTGGFVMYLPPPQGVHDVTCKILIYTLTVSSPPNNFANFDCKNIAGACIRERSTIQWKEVLFYFI